MRVHELMPGMVFEGMPGHPNGAMVVCTCPHPVFEGFTLVVWKMQGRSPARQYEFDALSPMMELPMKWVGQTVEEMKAEWKEQIVGK